MKDKIILTVAVMDLGIVEDLEVPVDITANDLIEALYEIYGFDMGEKSINECYLKTNNPKALLKGEKTLKDFGLYDATEVYFWK